jgi:hypothetical protein
MWDSVTLCVKDAEDQASLAERVALEQVSRTEAENAMALASTREDAKAHAQKVTLLEDELAAEHRAHEMSKSKHRAHF